MNRDKILIAIPARAGSKRLKNKNVHKIQGKPMLAYTIEAAFNSQLTDEIYVCTEDDLIQDIAIEYGAKVHRIPIEMAGDYVSSTVPCLDLLVYLQSSNIRFDYLFNLQPTSPLRSASDIKESLNVIKEMEADFLVSTTEVDPHFFHWALHKENKWWAMFFGKKFLKERSFLPKFYRPNGAIKLGKANEVLDKKNFFGEKLAVYEMPEFRSIHVSTEFDMACVNGIISSEKFRKT